MLPLWGGCAFVFTLDLSARVRHLGGVWVVPRVLYWNRPHFHLVNVVCVASASRWVSLMESHVRSASALQVSSGARLSRGSSSACIRQLADGFSPRLSPGGSSFVHGIVLVPLHDFVGFCHGSSLSRQPKRCGLRYTHQPEGRVQPSGAQRCVRPTPKPLCYSDSSSSAASGPWKQPPSRIVRRPLTLWCGIYSLYAMLTAGLGSRRVRGPSTA